MLDGSVFQVNKAYSSILVINFFFVSPIIWLWIFFASTQHTRENSWWKLREMFLEKWFILVLLDGFLLGFLKYWLFEVEKLVLFFIFGHIVRLFMLSHANRIYLGLSQRWMYFRNFCLFYLWWSKRMLSQWLWLN